MLIIYAFHVSYIRFKPGREDAYDDGGFGDDY